MNKLITLIPFILLVSCASSSLEYAAARNDRDEGYTETQLAANRYRVTFSGDASAPDDQIRDYALLRAAELTLLNGHDWFRVLGRESDREVEQSAPLTSLSTGSRIERNCGLLGCSTTVSPTYSHIQVSGHDRPGRLSSSVEIVMGDGEVDDPASVYDAAELRRFISAKYES